MRVKRLRYRKDEAVASTIGMIFALSLVTLLMTTFITQYVPVYMKGNEAKHDYQVQAQMGNLRTTMDLLALSGSLNYSTYVPITLGADGIPGFASPTVGQLTVNPFLGTQSSHYILVSFTDAAGNNISTISGGSVEFLAPNKYYVPERMVLESGAFFVENIYQNSSSMRMEPNIQFFGNESQRTIYMTLYTIYGPAKISSGIETRFIKLTLYGVESRKYPVSLGNVSITVKSRYAYTWNSWFQTEYGISGTVVGDTMSITVTNVTSVQIVNVYLYMEVSS